MADFVKTRGSASLCLIQLMNRTVFTDLQYEKKVKLSSSELQQLSLIEFTVYITTTTTYIRIERMLLDICCLDVGCCCLDNQLVSNHFICNSNVSDIQFTVPYK